MDYICKMKYTKHTSIYNKRFVLLSGSMFFFMLSINIILPQLNEMIDHMNSSQYKAFSIGLFTLIAGLSRPFSGKIADNVSRKSVIYFGVLTSVICCLIYPFVSTITLFLLLRLLHGFSTGFQPTGITAIVTDIAPSNKRGEIMGVFGVVISLGMGLGLSLSSYIEKIVGLNNLFFIASMLGFLSFIFSLFIKETLICRKKFTLKFIKITKNEILDKNVFLPSLIMFLTASCTGVIFTITPDMGNYLIFENKGLFFMYYVSATIGVRFFAGKISDKWGRRKTLNLGLFILGIAMLVTGFSQNKTTYICGAILYGIASGISSPTLFAWTADLANPTHRGRGIGTMFIALEFGIMFGSIICFALYKNTWETAKNPFISGAFTCFLAIFLLFFIKKDKPFSKFGN